MLDEFGVWIYVLWIATLVVSYMFGRVNGQIVLARQLEMEKAEAIAIKPWQTPLPPLPTRPEVHDDKDLRTWLK